MRKEETETTERVTRLCTRLSHEVPRHVTLFFLSHVGDNTGVNVQVDEGDGGDAFEGGFAEEDFVISGGEDDDDREQELELHKLVCLPLALGLVVSTGSARRAC
jgi:hypothetical protein